MDWYAGRGGASGQPLQGDEVLEATFNGWLENGAFAEVIPSGELHHLDLVFVGRASMVSSSVPPFSGNFKADDVADTTFFVEINEVSVHRAHGSIQTWGTVVVEDVQQGEVSSSASSSVGQ